MEYARWRRTNGSMQMQFRRSLSEPTNIGAISAWLRMGEQLAEKAETPHYDEARLRTKLAEIRALTQLPQQESEPQLKRLLQEAGVTLVLVPAIPSAQVSGVARWLNPHGPLIQLSLYGKSNDRFWFTLFHDLAHILLHSKKKSVFLDDPSKADSSSKEEQQANAWARDFLIPAEQAQQLAALGKSKTEIRHFAKKTGIHPGIVVGRLQHEKLIAITWMNDLKDGFQFLKMS
jgi:HTH-type transcriptional regulator/antitoxin HigA